MAEYRDYWYHSSDGLQLYARDYPCRARIGASRATILCMHGLTRNSADFGDLADHLSEGYRVIAVDQRGRGRSDSDPVIANYTPQVYVQDMFQLLDQLQLDHIALVGTSMGGLMALIMAAMQPDRVSAMVINDIGPEVDPAGLARIKSYVGKSAPVHSWDEAVAQAREINAAAFPDFSQQQWEAFTRGIYRDVGGVPQLAYDAAIATPMADEASGAVPPDLWPVYDASNAIPLLLIRGASSDILAPSCVDQMRQRRPGMEFVEVPNRGHAPTLDERPARESIDRFLAACTQGPLN